MHHHRMSDGERGEPWGASVAQNPSRVTDRPSRRLPFTPTIPEVQPVPGQGEGQPHNGDDKLFIQLLDDLDNISGGSQASVHRRRRAREIFSEWLFSQDVHNPQVMRLKSEQSGRRLSGGDFGEFDLKKQGRQHSCDAEPFSREQSSRRSCGVLSDLSVHRRGLLRRTRPSSFHYPSEDEDDSGYHTGNSTALQTSVKRRPPSARTYKERTWIQLDVKQRIEAFNQNNQGLFMEMSEDGLTFQGFIRIHMNLTSPISISAQPPSFGGYQNCGAEESTQMSRSKNIQVTTSFCLPKNTTKVIHISSMDSTQEVIKALLAKFSITDNPQKFVLFEKIEGPGKIGAIRQMKDDELPLSVCLSWTDEGGIRSLENNKFILQEVDTGEIEILWKSFNLVELESFLNVLNREEAEHVDQVRMKYRKLKIEIQKHLQQKQPNAPSGKKHTPVFV